MKKMRKLVPAFAMLMVAAIMMSTASFAWFSMSTTATVTGMEVSAQAASSMIISNTKNGVGDAYFADRKISVDFAGTTGALTPATWTGTALQYPTNPDTDVDVNTGKLASGAAMSDAQAGTHYIDFEMYLASAGEATKAGTLTVVFTGLDAVTKDIHNALSIQVLYKENKADSLDHVGIVQAASIGTTNKVEITNLVIPAAFTQDTDGDYTEETNDYVTVVFRVYFDGDLESNVAGKNYVRNGTMDTTGIKFGASYSFKVNP